MGMRSRFVEYWMAGKGITLHSVAWLEMVIEKSLTKQLLQCFMDDIITTSNIALHPNLASTFTFRLPGPYDTESVAMNAPLFEAALRTCTRSPRSPAYRNALLRRNHLVSRSHQRRCISDGQRPGLPPGLPQKAKVVAPKTRVAVGVVFIGILIYSMVRCWRVPKPLELSIDFI